MTAPVIRPLILVRSIGIHPTDIDAIRVADGNPLIPSWAPVLEMNKHVGAPSGHDDRVVPVSVRVSSVVREERAKLEPENAAVLEDDGYEWGEDCRASCFINVLPPRREVAFFDEFLSGHWFLLIRCGQWRRHNAWVRYNKGI